MTITPEIYEEICKELESSPDGVQRIVNSFGYDVKQFYRMVNSSDTACQRYARAKEKQCDNIADDLFHITDNCVDPNKARVQIDARKFYLSKIKPKKYGDHQVIEVKYEISKLIEAFVSIIIEYIPEQKRSEALVKLQSSIDFEGMEQLNYK